RERHALFLDTRSLEIEHVPLDPDGDSLRLMVVDTRVHHSHGDGAYGDRRAACERAARALDVGSLRELSSDGLDARLRALDVELARRVRHVVAENARVLQAVQHLRRRDWARLGECLVASHVSLRDDYDVSCAELDVAVEAALAGGALGSRMTGGGFGGSAVVLAPAIRVPDVRETVTRAFADRGWADPGIAEVTPSAGARRDD
ncbi:MAG: galactokinase, partial [Actinomycetes bacterium]